MSMSVQACPPTSTSTTCLPSTFTSHSPGTPEEARWFARVQECQHKIYQIAEKIYAPKRHPPIPLEVNRSICSSPKLNDGDEISIPYLFLLKSTDIPEEFRIQDLDDPRLQSDAFLQRAADWTHHFLGQQAKRPLTLMERETIKFFLQYIKDPEKSEQCKEFILAHEIGHLVCEHCTSMGGYMLLQNLKAIGLILLCQSPSYYISTQLFWTVLVISAILTAGFVTSVLVRTIHHNHSNEKEADLIAAQFQEKQGAIYFHETFTEAMKRSRRQSITLRLIFNTDGNTRLSLTHPSSTERIRYLKAYSK